MKSFTIAGLLVAAAFSNAQTFTQWNFNSIVGDANGSTGVTSTSIGAGTASLIGGTTATFAAGGTTAVAPASSSDTNNTDDSAWNTTGYSTLVSESGKRGVRFNVSTAQTGGYQNIIVKFDARHSNTSSRFLKFEYTVDGTNFLSTGLANDGVVEATLGGDTWYNGRSFDLSTITSANNNSNFGFRITAVTNPANNTWAAATTTSTYAATGTLRFDMVSVEGQPVPEPATMAILGLGCAALARRRSRKA